MQVKFIFIYYEEKALRFYFFGVFIILKILNLKERNEKIYANFISNSFFANGGWY